MSNQQGWISIHRKIIDNWVWDDKPFSKGQAWIDLLLMANHQDKKILFNGSLLEVKSGERITSLKQLSSQWGWSTTKTKRFLEMLQDDGMITYKSDAKKTVYNIVNYNDYQDLEKTKNNAEVKQKKNRSKTEVKQKKTNNNDNNDNNELIMIDKMQEEEFIEKWNRNFNQQINQSHLNQSINRLSNYSFDEILKTLDRATNSDYLKGLTENNRYGLTLKFFTNPINFEKIKSGAYDTFKDKKGNNLSLHEKDNRMTKKEREEFINKKLSQKIPIKYRNK